MEYAVCAASSDSEDSTTELEEELPSTKKLRGCKQTSFFCPIEKTEYAACAASSDSEDATTELEEERVASNTGQQGPLFEIAAESTSDAQGSIGFAFINKAAPPRESWDSLDVLKVEAGEKPNHKDIQNLIHLIHFAKNDGNEVPVLGGVHSTLAVNVLEEDRISYCDLEDHTIQTIHEDDEQELVIGEDLQFHQEVKFHSSTSEIGICQKQNPRRSEVQRKRNLTGGQSQASKLVKRSEQPQKVQMPHARTGWGERAPDQTPFQSAWGERAPDQTPFQSAWGERAPDQTQFQSAWGERAPDQTPFQWSESFQTRHLEGNYSAKDPINYAQSTEFSSPSSQLVKRQEVHIGAVTKYKCSNCSMSFSKKAGLSTHIGVWHNVEQRLKCKKCNAVFDSMLRLDWHSATAHNVFGRVTCVECGKVCPNQLAFENHQCAINVIKPVSFPCTESSLQFSYFSNLFHHRTLTHQSPFK